jgi:MoaA/NifB/PqqE/SkfB family radical SAM enzyme
VAAKNERVIKKSNAAAFENFLKTKYERLTGATHTRSYPYVLMIDPTNICQLRCPNCGTGMINELRRTQHAALDFGRPITRLARGVLDSIMEECGDVAFYCLFFSAGEPLLNEELPEFISAASRHDIFTKFDTNLSLHLSDEKLEALLKSGLGELAASIDGFSQATYEQYRRGGRFELALDNLTRLAAMRDRLGSETRLTWNFLVFSFNEHEAEDIAAFCRQHDILFNPKDPILLKSQSDWLPSQRQTSRRDYQDIELQSAQWTSPAGPIPLYMARPEKRSCAWHYGYAIVRADGGVAPCCRPARKNADFGDVTDEPGSFGRIWNNDSFAAARRLVPEGTEVKEYPVAMCSQCKHPEPFLDLYAVLDREIVHRYWSLPEGTEARQFDELFMLLQQSPSTFAAAYAQRYEAAETSEL